MEFHPRKLFTLFLFVLTLNFIRATNNLCECPEYITPPQEIINDPFFVPGEIIINGVNYGKPTVVGQLIFVTKDITIEKSTKSFVDSCPLGFRLPKKDELTQMLIDLGTKADEILSDPNGFNYNNSLYYMTNEKVYPDITDGSLAEAWEFYGLKKSGNSYSVTSINSYFNSSLIRGRCIQDLDKFDLNIEGLEHDLITNQNRSIKLDTSTIKGHLIRMNNILYTEKEIELQSSKNRGCNLFEGWVNTLNDKTLYFCRVLFTRPKLGSNKDIDFSMDKVSILSHEFSAERVRSIYFERAQAPITPKTDGGYYMLYTDYLSSEMHVVEFNSKDEIQKDKNLEYKAHPFDIIETDYGFAIYARLVNDPNHAFVLTYNSDYTLRDEITIINNGPNLTEYKEGLVFYDDQGQPLFGLNVTFEPENGKLSYGRNKLNLIFAHYNNFGPVSGNHTGDTYFSFDLTGSIETAKYAWNWQCSHSLIQSHIYDGRYFITAALGDAFPENIAINVIDILKGGNEYDKVRDAYPNIKFTENKEFVPLIPGNHIGDSMGRLAGVLNFDSFYVVVFSIKKSENDTRDGIFLTKFDYANEKLNILNTYTIITGVAGSMKNIRCAKYGNRILITYILNNNDYGIDYPSRYQETTETMYYLLSDTEGKLINGPFKSDKQIEALNEDIRELRDGSLRWAYIDRINVLRIVKVNFEDEEEESIEPESSEEESIKPEPESSEEESTKPEPESSEEEEESSEEESTKPEPESSEEEEEEKEENKSKFPLWGYFAIAGGAIIIIGLIIFCIRRSIKKVKSNNLLIQE